MINVEADTFEVKVWNIQIDHLWKKEPSVWEKARGRRAAVKVMRRWALQGRNVG